MNKKLLYVGGGLLVVAAGVYFGLAFFLGHVVQAGVNSFGPKLTKTKVELAGARISPFTGTGTLTGLFVGNPEGWNADRAFYLGKIHVDVEPFSVLGDHVVINEVSIDQPEFVYETKLVSSNIKDLLKNIEEFTGGGTKTADTPTTKSGKPIKFVVKKFRITNAKATLGVGPAAIPLPLPPINLDNLGVAEGGITPDQVAGAVMKQVLANIVTASAQALTKVGGTAGATAVESAKDAAKKAGDGLKKLFGGDKPKP